MERKYSPDKNKDACHRHHDEKSDAEQGNYPDRPKKTEANKKDKQSDSSTSETNTDNTTDSKASSFSSFFNIFKKDSKKKPVPSSSTDS